MRCHTGHGEAIVRPLPATIIIAVLPLGIGHDRLPADFVESNILRRMAGRAGYDQCGTDPFRPVGGEGQRLHPAHRSADHAVQLLDPQRIKDAHLRPHHVADGDHWKAHGIGLAIGAKAGRPGRAIAAAQHIGADHEEPVGIDRLARPDHPHPPTRLAGNRMRAGHALIAGQGMEDHHRVRFCGVKRAVSLIGHAHAAQRLPAIKGERPGVLQHVALGHKGFGIGHDPGLGEREHAVNCP